MTKKLFCFLFLCLFLLSCGKKEKKQVEKEPDLSLKKVTFSDLTGWQKDAQHEAFKAFLASCAKIDFEKRENLPGAEIKISTTAWQEVCRKAKKISPRQFKNFIEQNFTPYLISWQGNATGKFTSYYESELFASKKQSEKYKFPIYGRPSDLIEINLRDFDPSLPEKRLLGRIEKQKFVPYYNREEIHKNGVKAPVILWGDDEIDIYIMQIQGSAVARLDDGSSLRIAFADTNGREFRGIGSILLEQKLLKPNEASMLGIKRWLRSHPESAIKQMNKNQRYVFHRLNTQDGPVGAQGVALTPKRSLAVDRKFIPLGALLWLETNGPEKESINSLVIAQDVGGAIKGAVRGDFFWGSGSDDVLDKAGRMNSSGRYFIFIPKNQEQQP